MNVVITTAARARRVGRLSSLLVVALLAFGFLFALGFSPLTHAYSNTLVNDSTLSFSSASSAMISTVQTNTGDLMVIQSVCSSGSFQNSNNGIVYGWSQSYGITGITDTKSQAWSRAAPDYSTATNQIISTWYSQAVNSGVVTYTLSYSGTVGNCAVFWTEYNTASNLLPSNYGGYTTGLAICQIATDTMADSACNGVTYTKQSTNIATYSPTLIVELGVAGCQPYPTAGASLTWQGTGTANSVIDVECAYSADNAYQSTWDYFASSGTVTGPGLEYNFGTQGDSHAADYYTSFYTYQEFYSYARSLTVGYVAFSTTGQSSLTFQTNSVNGCNTPSNESTTAVANEPYWYFGTTGVSGFNIQELGAYVNVTESQAHITGSDVAAIQLAVYSTPADTVNIPVSASNPLTEVPGSWDVWLVSHTSDQSLYATALSVVIPPDSTWALAMMTNSTLVYLSTNGAAVIQNLFNSSVITPTSPYALLPSSVFYVQYNAKTYCFGAIGITPSVSTYVTQTFNTVVTTYDCVSAGACSSYTETVTSTQTQLQEVNDPNMSALNYWLIPMLVIFIPFLVVIAAFIRATTIIDPQVIVPVGLMAISLSGWLGYAWSAYVPIYIPFAFTVALIVYGWRST
jgi:hypothetical protein